VNDPYDTRLKEFNTVCHMYYLLRCWSEVFFSLT